MNACTKIHARFSPFLLLLFMMVSRSTRGFLTWWCIDIDSIINSRCQRPSLFFFTPVAVFFLVGWFFLPSGKKSLCTGNHETSGIPVASSWGIVEKHWLHLGLTRSTTGFLSVQEIMGGLSGSVQEIMSLNFDRMGRRASDTHTQTKTSVEIRDFSIYGKQSMSWIFRWYQFFSARLPSF